MGNYYEILEVSPTASQEEIKKAYLRLSKHYHPDTGGEYADEEQLKKINAAYAVLSGKEQLHHQQKTEDEMDREQADERERKRHEELKRQADERIRKAKEEAERIRKANEEEAERVRKINEEAERIRKAKADEDERIRKWYEEYIRQSREHQQQTQKAEQKPQPEAKTEPPQEDAQKTIYSGDFEGYTYSKRKRRPYKAKPIRTVYVNPKPSRQKKQKKKDNFYDEYDEFVKFKQEQKSQKRSSNAGLVVGRILLVIIAASIMSGYDFFGIGAFFRWLGEAIVSPFASLW